MVSQRHPCTSGQSQFHTQEGDHLITLISSLGCDSLVLLHLEYYQIFIPNVFSPNNDGINDIFTVFSEAGLVINQRLLIFDRWGRKVYEGIEWDGTSNGAFANQGVFAFIAKITFDDNIERQFSGSITLIR